MSFDLRQHLDWDAVAADPAMHRIIQGWTEQEPSASMRFARPPESHRWLWEIVLIFAPHSMPMKSRCADTSFFSAKNEAEFGAGHAAWLAQARPAGLDRVLLLLRDNLFDVTWDEYVRCFAPQAPHCLACTPDLRWMALGYFDEFIVTFRPRWDAIQGIERIRRSMTPDGWVTRNDRLVLRFDDPDPAGSQWESDAIGERGDPDTLAMMAGVISGITGLPVVDRDADPC